MCFENNVLKLNYFFQLLEIPNEVDKIPFILIKTIDSFELMLYNSISKLTL